MATLSSVKLDTEKLGRKHPALGKLVYVIPEDRFARIEEVEADSLHFHVQKKKERGRDTEHERHIHELATRREDGSVKAIGRQETVQWNSTDLLDT